MVRVSDENPVGSVLRSLCYRKWFLHGIHSLAGVIDSVVCQDIDDVRAILEADDIDVNK